MAEIDRYMLHSLQELIDKSLKAYETYELHIIYHSLHNYCTLDLSSFYLDILKDRLYTSPSNSLQRRSAQTTIYKLLNAIVRLMAPVLPFTAEEVWFYMPAVKEKEESINLALLPKVDEKYKDAELAGHWNLILELRGEVTKALETARAQKLIGHSLDASVTISADEKVYNELHPYRDELRSILIVSEASLLKGEKLEDSFESEILSGLTVNIKKSADDKCERCWVHDVSVGGNTEQPTICNRCQTALEEMNI
jgi:isoleucyl-tRNA synthetase